jgi:hypothetical protein
MSTFKVAGISKLNGVYKVRFANDMLRVKVLEKNGHKDVDLVEFINPLTKEEAVRKLIEMDFAKGNVDIQLALGEALGKRSPKAAVAGSKAPKAKAKAPAKKATVVKAQKAKVKAAVPVTEDEDAPF